MILAAKNFNDVLTVSEMAQYPETLGFENNGASSSLAVRKFAATAFNVSSHYDTAIYNYFKSDESASLKQSIRKSKPLRYGENPHQKGTFYGELDEVFTKLNGKEFLTIIYLM